MFKIVLCDFPLEEDYGEIIFIGCFKGTPIQIKSPNHF